MVTFFAAVWKKHSVLPAAKIKVNSLSWLWPKARMVSRHVATTNATKTHVVLPRPAVRRVSMAINELASSMCWNVMASYVIILASKLTSNSMFLCSATSVELFRSDDWLEYPYDRFTAGPIAEGGILAGDVLFPVLNKLWAKFCASLPTPQKALKTCTM